MVTQAVELPVSPTELLHRCVTEPGAFVLDGCGEDSWGIGYAILGFRPSTTLRVSTTGAMLRREGRTQRMAGDPIALLEQFCLEGAPSEAFAPAFGGGVIAALSYDLGGWIEPRVCARADDAPLVHAARYDWLLVYSYALGRYYLASAVLSQVELQRLTDELRALARGPAPATPASAAPCAIPHVTSQQYMEAVRAVLDYVAAGDAYQVNLAHRFTVHNPPSPAALFNALQRRHPVPFAAYVDAGDFTLVSNSPECFLMLDGDAITTYPIKGTRPRGGDSTSDRALVAELQHDPKERAEHVMIVDLERNDLGRVCRTGSVRVEEFARVHTFRSLHHMVSTVRGRLRDDASLADVLRATFPGGSITGAPKIRAMQIISELEPVNRGFYTGAIGLVHGPRQALFNLAIRTVVATPGRFTYDVGGGIVADSIPAREYDETLLKAQAFLDALAAAAA